jgi:hypothetical protein
VVTLAVDKILVTVGRKPATEGWDLDAIDLDMDGPFIRIDDKCRTSMRGVYAIGDVTGEPMLAHRATAQGEMVAEIVAGEKRSWDKVCIPAVCFTDPEIVTAGLSPDEAKAAGIEFKTGLFPFWANGRAMTLEKEAGFIRVVARADNHLLLGIQGVWAPGLRNCRPASAWRSRWARGSRTSPQRSMPTRPRAKVFWRPLSRLWAIRCISRLGDQPGQFASNAFAPDRSGQPFRKAILPRGARRDGLVTNAHGAQPPREDIAVDAVPIANQVARSIIPGENRSLHYFDGLPEFDKLLLHPHDCQNYGKRKTCS